MFLQDLWPVPFRDSVCGHDSCCAGTMSRFPRESRPIPRSLRASMHSGERLEAW